MARTGTKLDSSIFYNFGDILSRNGVYNFVVGGRGIGKTYGAKKLVIKNYLKYGDQFIYLRRYKTELKSSVRTFFADVSAEFPGLGFRSDNGVFQLTRNPQDDKPKWETIGYPVALSQSQSMKSVSFPLVTFIIYDEVIIERGAVHYLPDEHMVFNNFYSTVDRGQDRVRVLLLANSVSIMNPYFIAYDIVPRNDMEWVKRYDGFIQCHFPRSSAFSEAVSRTRFGRFISGTEYERYAVGNEFLDSTQRLIGNKPATADYVFSIIGSGGSMSVWREGESLWAQKRRPGEENKLTFEPELTAEDCVLMVKNDTVAQMLRGSFRRGNMLFDNPNTRNMFVKMIGC